jgi:hypothetical protein
VSFVRGYLKPAHSENLDTRERLQIVPGELRRRGVAVGWHIPPAAEQLPAFMDRFEQAYVGATNEASAADRRSIGSLSSSLDPSISRWQWLRHSIDVARDVARSRSWICSLVDFARPCPRSTEYKCLLMAAGDSHNAIWIDEAHRPALSLASVCSSSSAVSIKFGTRASCSSPQSSNVTIKCIWQ